VTLFLVFFAIQLIQPVHNKSGQASSIDLAILYAVPNNVQRFCKMPVTIATATMPAIPGIPTFNQWHV
jgi:hypothetical protein